MILSQKGKLSEKILETASSTESETEVETGSDIGQLHNESNEGGGADTTARPSGTMKLTEQVMKLDRT